MSTTAQVYLSGIQDRRISLYRPKNGRPVFFGPDILEVLSQAPQGNAPSGERFPLVRLLVEVGGARMAQGKDVEGDYIYQIEERKEDLYEVQVLGPDGEIHFEGRAEELPQYVNERRRYWNGERLLLRLKNQEENELLRRTSPLEQIDSEGQSIGKGKTPAFEKKVRTWVNIEDGTLMRRSPLTGLPHISIEGEPSPDGLLKTSGRPALVDWAAGQCVTDDRRIVSLKDKQLRDLARAYFRLEGRHTQGKRGANSQMRAPHSCRFGTCSEQVTYSLN